MGDEQVTVKNLRVIGRDEAKGLLLIAGAVPGATNATVRVCHAKTPGKKRTRQS
jgi:large subunit ribosomal protein L3